MGGKIVVLLVAAQLLTLGLVAGCGTSSPANGGSQSAPTSKADEPEVTKATATGAAPEARTEGESSDGPRPVVLTVEERQKLGITTTPAQAITFNDSSTAFGVVLAHETIAQAVADLETAASAAHQSEIALTRGQKLAAGPGALGTDILETLQRQKSTDQAALALARRKITAVVGVKFPWQGANDDTGILDALASGEAKLVRATFPTGVLVGTAPKSLRLVTLEPAVESASRTGDPPTEVASLTATPVWDAPQDPNIPGRSFFALVRKADIAEGARFQALPSAPTNGIAGVLVPASSVIITGGQYWCYLEKKTGTFARVPIVVAKPLGAGYFLSEGLGVADGDQVVTGAAGLLLAHEMGAASGPED
jgi:hypothetical protein